MRRVRPISGLPRRFRVGSVEKRETQQDNSRRAKRDYCGCKLAAFRDERWRASFTSATIDGFEMHQKSRKTRPGSRRGR